MKEEYNIDTFLKSLKTNLITLNYDVFTNYQIPSFGTEKKLETIDYYIASPIRAFIEISFTNHLTEEKRSSILRLRETFADLILPIVIILRKPGEGFKHDFDLDEFMIIVKKTDELSSFPEIVAMSCATEIITNIDQKKFPINKTNVVKYQNSDFINPYEELKNNLNEIIASFKKVIPQDALSLLYKECYEIDIEYEKQHYDSAILRCGRAIELIIYSLAVNAWKVPINENVVETINNLKMNLSQINKSYIDFVNDIENKEKIKSLQKNIESAVSRLTALMGTIPIVETKKDIEYSKETFPYPVQSILYDMLKTEENSKIKEQLETVINPPNKQGIAFIMDRRNKAAHASQDFEWVESSRDDFLEVYFELKQVLFALSNVAALKSIPEVSDENNDI